MIHDQIVLLVSTLQLLNALFGFLETWLKYRGGPPGGRPER